MIVRDVMTQSPIAVPRDTSVRSAIALLEPLEIRHLPVVDAEGRLAGLVAERDLHSFYAPRQELAGNWAEQVRAKLDEPVSRVMVTPAISVGVDAPITTAIERMLDGRVSALPVLDGEKLVGIVSYVDVLRAFAIKLSSAGSGNE
ncbi:MAG: CBS domain-containing protein [Polyangiaceae bacterium]|nr:CBS domain-containing protein [Polyangiaceae bacterium]